MQMETYRNTTVWKGLPYIIKLNRGKTPEVEYRYNKFVGVRETVRQMYMINCHSGFLYKGLSGQLDIF